MSRSSLFASVLFTVALTLPGATSAQVKVHHVTQEDLRSLLPPPGYLIGDSVIVREKPSLEGNIVTSLGVGSRVELIGKTGEDTLLVLRGIESAWYKVRTGKNEGWMWGGNIAARAFGSNADPAVKFLVGFSGEREVQVRAVKAGKQVGKVTFGLYASYFEANLYGSMGLDGITDVITVDEPCEGGCGCGYGTHYLFWDGARLHYVMAAMGIADGESGEWSTLLFPSSMEVEKNHLKLITDTIDWEYQHDSVRRRVHTARYFTWNGTTLVEAKGRREKPQFYYVNDETGLIVEDPEVVAKRQREEEEKEE